LALIDARRGDLHPVPVSDIGVGEDAEWFGWCVERDRGVVHAVDRSPVDVGLPAPRLSRHRAFQVSQRRARIVSITCVGATSRRYRSVTARLVCPSASRITLIAVPSLANSAA
jgi:hypothetical protein